MGAANVDNLPSLNLPRHHAVFSSPARSLNPHHYIFSLENLLEMLRLRRQPARREGESCETLWSLAARASLTGPLQERTGSWTGQTMLPRPGESPAGKGTPKSPNKPLSLQRATASFLLLPLSTSRLDVQGTAKPVHSAPLVSCMQSGGSNNAPASTMGSDNRGTSRQQPVTGWRLPSSLLQAQESAAEALSLSPLPRALLLGNQVGDWPTNAGPAGGQGSHWGRGRAQRTAEGAPHMTLHAPTSGKGPPHLNAAEAAARRPAGRTSH